MAQQIERVEIFPHLFGQYIPKHTKLLKLINDELFAVRRVPLTDEVIKRCVVFIFEQRFAGVVLEGFGHQFAIRVVILYAFRQHFYADTVNVEFTNFVFNIFFKSPIPFA
ncbi:hypothetical protein D3C75_1107590 [compost metagenome]